MSELLQQAITEIKKLPLERQNEIANRILAELQKETKKSLLNKLSSTEAFVWSPQTNDAGVKALANLLTATQQNKNAE